MRRRPQRIGGWIGAIALATLALGLGRAQPTITGTLESYTDGPADIVAETREGVMWLPVDLGRGSLAADGHFTIALRPSDEVPAEVFLPIDTLFPQDRCADLTISDPAAMVVTVRDLRVIPQGASCEYCGTVGTVYAATQERGRLPRTGDASAAWFLVDRAVNVSGTCTYGWGQEVYDLSLEPGWNPVVLEATQVQATTDFCECVSMSVQQRPLADAPLHWYYTPYR